MSLSTCFDCPYRAPEGETSRKTEKKPGKTWKNTLDQLRQFIKMPDISMELALLS
jgi:hypothetical protein